MGKETSSIFLTIKKMLGLDDAYAPFDTDIMVHINSALLELCQLGVGPKDGFEISGYDETWNEFITDAEMLGAVQNYIYLTVKKLFDPPTNSFVLDSIDKQIEKLGWRLNIQAESKKIFDFITDDENARKRGWPGNENIQPELSSDSQNDDSHSSNPGA